MRTCFRFGACAAVAIAVQMPASSVFAQISKEWSQCVGREGAVADVIISGCSAVIQAAQDTPARLATAFNNRGVAYKYKGEYERALDDYNHAILLNPDFANAYNNRGVIHRIKGEYDLAIRDYNQSISLDRTIPATYYNRAIAYIDNQDYDRALADFNTVLGFNNKNYLALYGRGVVELKKRDTQASAADIAAAKSINPNVAAEFERSSKP